MGPINIRYHVISLAAVFLALGVGIIVGSNTNFFGISSLIDKQNTVIARLEENYKEIRKEVRETREELDDRVEYVKTLEDDVVARLLSGKLDGLRLGVMMVGEFHDENTNTDALTARLKAAGATIRWKMDIPMKRLEELMDADPTQFGPRLSGELLGGSAYGTRYTDDMINQGMVQSGGFEEPVDGVIFVLGDELDIRLTRRILLVLESEITNKKGIAVNVVPGENRNYRNIFRARQFPFFQNVSGLPGQADAISGLGEIYIQKKEMNKGGA